MHRKKILSMALSLVAIICMMLALYLWIHYKKEDDNIQGALADSDKLLNDDSFNDGSFDSVDSSDSQTTDSSDTEPVTYLTNPYADKFAENEDMTAWLSIPGTVVDYPVMWTPFDETYYLYRDFEKKDNSNGSLILDTDSSLEPLTTNLIIHGHNMKSGAMFGSLTSYENEDYYKEHKNILLYTKTCEKRYEILAVFRSQVYKKSQDVFKFYKFFEADTEEDFLDFYNNIKALSIYDTGVTAEFGDHFITLSTCVYHVKNGRFVVVAKEIEPGDYYLPLEE